MLSRNWIYNTIYNVITIFAGTASSEPYICYYCHSAATHTTSILDHTICYHPNETFTYRYLLLDETDGIMKYRSRHFHIPCSSLRREKNNGNNISTSRVILVLFVLPIWILIDMQRWIQPLYIYITAYCQSVMLLIRPDWKAVTCIYSKM